MADLFEGAPPEWLQDFGEKSFHALDNNVMKWLYDKAVKNAPPEMVGDAGDAAYSAVQAVQRMPDSVKQAYMSRVPESPEEQMRARDAAIMASTHADPNWQRQPQFGAGFDQWARNKVDSLDDVSSRVAQTARDSVGSLAGQIYGDEPE